MSSLRHAALFASVPLLVLAFAACSGEVATATGGSGGGTGAGNGTGGEAPVCPSSPPTLGAPCSTSGQSCSYGNTYCPLLYQCAESGWQALGTGCAEPPISCPAEPPAPGTGCDPCFESGPCTYPCNGTSAQVTATCAGSVWSFDATCPAPPPPDCNGTLCKPGEICLETGGGAGLSFTCVIDPCAPAPLACACATSLCSGAQNACSVMGQTLSCDCLTCP
jgi:hypothetical protein